MDKSRLEDISGGDIELEKELISMFRDSYKTCAKQLQEASMTSDIDLWYTAMHELKGSAYNIGLESLGALCAENENFINIKNSYRDLFVQIKKIMVSFDEFCENTYN